MWKITHLNFKLFIFWILLSRNRYIFRKYARLWWTIWKKQTYWSIVFPLRPYKEVSRLSLVLCLSCGSTQSGSNSNNQLEVIYSKLLNLQKLCFLSLYVFYYLEESLILDCFKFNTCEFYLKHLLST
jgi:hypothetical protein